MRKSYVLNAFISTPWAILHDRLGVLEEIVSRHVAGDKLDPEEVQLIIHGAIRPADRTVSAGSSTGGDIAILPLFGTIFPRANLMTEMSGATSAEMFGKQFDALMADPKIGGIILDVNSPGGQTMGIEEVARKIYDARGTKPIVAVANHLMASAAYWIGTAADELVVTPSGEVGSIGVFAVHLDQSKAMEMDGIKPTIISEGKYKVEGNPFEPLGEEARAAIQGGVKETYGAFTQAVARYRRTPIDQVRNGFGEGRMVGARQAVELGMADRVGTMDETIHQLQRRLFKLSKEEQKRAESLRERVNLIMKGE